MERERDREMERESDREGQRERDAHTERSKCVIAKYPYSIIMYYFLFIFFKV